MRVILQRASKASVSIDNKLYSKINKGLVVLVGFTKGDTEKDIIYLVNKIINLRIFDDEYGKINMSIKDINGSILSISQFTLYANVLNGRRPSFEDALDYNEASILYDKFNILLRESNIKVETGIFGASMQVELINDGPLTIIIDSKE
ncbi:MAG: D-aminoacyl-tRNA deacylase [Bacilli bacterium]|nr:D-aminoacyl-tRNA deacylase [Bacilli bacterium]